MTSFKYVIIEEVKTTNFHCVAEIAHEDLFKTFPWILHTRIILII